MYKSNKTANVTLKNYLSQMAKIFDAIEARFEKNGITPETIAAEIRCTGINSVMDFFGLEKLPRNLAKGMSTDSVACGQWVYDQIKSEL